jgi:hypothetical protein
MNPRRLIPYVVIFLVLVGAYLVLLWQQGQQVAREQEAKKVFKVQEKDIQSLALIRGGSEIRLVKKKDFNWHLVAPLKTRADQGVVDSMLLTLARLQKERDLGPVKDLKAFGLDQPHLVVEFAAQGKTHRLEIGSKVPGTRGYYSRLGQSPDILLISTASKDSLDRTLQALRDKTLLTFQTSEVKAIKLRSGKTEVDLDKTGPQAWRWVGRPDFRVRSDRVESLLRELHAARVKEFLAQPPKNLGRLGLAPRPKYEVTLVTGKGTTNLWLGITKDQGVYASRGPEGPVVLVDQRLEEEVAKMPSTLEDRRLWGGSPQGVHRVVWGRPGQSWTATKDKESWVLKGPQGGEVKQPGVRMELALWKLQNLEYATMVKQPAAGAKENFVLELFDASGKSLFRLEELGKKGDQEEIAARKGDQTSTALVPVKNLAEIHGDLARLTSPPPPK